MSFRPEIKPYPVILNGSMAGSITSSVTIIQKLSMISYGLSWSGTSPVGTISVQVSNDYSIDSTGAALNTGTWNAITFSAAGLLVSSIPISGNTGNGFIDIDQMAAYAIRVVYTRASGTGTLQCLINAKVS